MTRDLSLWQRVDALRELLHQGGLLLGEVVTLTRNAEESLCAAAAERKTLDQNRRHIEEECVQLRLQAQASSENLERQHSEIGLLRQEIERLRSVSTDSSQRVSDLQSELLRVRMQPAKVEHSSHELQRIADLQGRLNIAEARLEQARATLASERERRNRAISLIKPVASDNPTLQASPAK